MADGNTSPKKRARMDTDSPPPLEDTMSWKDIPKPVRMHLVALSRTQHSTSLVTPNMRDAIDGIDKSITACAVSVATYLAALPKADVGRTIAMIDAMAEARRLATCAVHLPTVVITDEDQMKN